MILQDLSRHFEDQLKTQFGGMVAGYVGAIQYGGETVTQTFGTANLNTGAPMTPDTLWLLGSVTKVLTATMILRLVDQGRVDLERRVVDYLPEFRLNQDGLAQAITVRQLLDHSNGINADTLMPTRDYGPRAVESYVDELRRCDLLFPPGALSHYTNPGFVLAGRIIERLEGIPYNAGLGRDLFAPLGMTQSCTSATQAILQPTAIGAFAGGPDGGLRATSMFMLPVSAAPAGATAIVTVADMLAFARMHLDHGKAHDGSRYLSPDSTALMRTISFDLGAPHCPPSGLGWRLVPIAGSVALCHSGGSPGGVSSLVVFPEFDLSIVGFATGPGGAYVFDPMVTTVLKALLGKDLTPTFTPGPPPTDLSVYEGRYSHFQSTLDVKAVDGKLVCQPGFPPYDDDHARFLLKYAGLDRLDQMQTPAYELEPVNDTLFKPVGYANEAAYGLWGRNALRSFHKPDASGRPQYMCAGWHAARRA